MAKKREWKAWMVVDKRGYFAVRIVFEDKHHAIRYAELKGDRVIRVRIIESDDKQ